MKYKINLHLFCIILLWCSVFTLIQAQSNGDIRLTDGDRGILEAYYNGWGPVCDDGWTSLNANVSCKILGYRSAISSDIFYYDSNINYTLADVDCIGNETNILNCSHSVYEDDYYYFYCGSYEHVHIICNPGYCESIAPTAEENPNPLQYFNDKSLYYVCADGFTEANGEVVCHENLGTTFYNHTSIELTSLNQTLPIFPYNYQCSGHENTLCHCNKTASVCNSNTVAHIQCQTPVNGTVRHNYFSELLQAYFGVWGYICDDYFDDVASDTVCRQLGFRRAVKYFGSSYHQNYDFEVDNIRCLGNQFSINDCDFQRTHDCYSYEHVAVRCEQDGCESLLPNIDGTSQIAYYYNGGHWNYICGNGVTNDVADVICRETGNTTARAYRSVALSFGPLTYPIYGSRFQCNGTESSLCDCESISETCSAMEIVEVQCDLPANGEVRLSEGHQGILEIYRNGWGFVCGYEWNQAASDIACQTLGFRRAHVNFTEVYRDETDPPSLNGANCLGNETTLFECEVYRYHLYCPPAYHISLTCIADGCESFAPYADERSVTIEYYDGSGWFYICADGFTDDVADVICVENSHKLHVSHEGVAISDLAVNNTIYPYTFLCTGMEDSLCDCTKIASTCTSNTVLAVQCESPANGDFRLTGGDQGEFQLYQDGWNSVCEFHYYYIYYYHTEREFWATPESNVACRTLGFRRVDTYSFPYVYLFSSNSIYTDFRCYGSETDLSQCYNESKSYCYDGVNIKCISDGCESLVPYANEGLVTTQFYVDQKWYTLCGDEFTQETADVICKENYYLLGAYNFTATTRSSWDYEIYPNRFNCAGNETTLCNCPTESITCSDQIITIQCRSQEIPAIRLTEGTSGQLLVNIADQWGFVCSFGWDQVSSDTTCRQLGYLRASSFSLYTSDFQLTYPSLLYFSTCSSSDFDNIFDCGYTNDTDYYTCGDSYVSLTCETEGCGTYLYNRSDSYQEVRYFADGQWYYICSEQLNDAVADLICSQYGRLGSTKAIPLSEAEQSFPIYPFAHNCVGSDAVCNCPQSAQTCTSDSILVVECTIPDDGDLRLTNVSQGILEIFYNDRWRYVCDDSFGSPDAEVACRKLGFKVVDSYMIGVTVDNPLEPGINYLYCGGDEQSLLDCSFSTASSYSCSSSEHVFLSCQTNACETYPAITSGTPTPIRVFRDMNWNYLCADEFTVANAEVICSANAQTDALFHYATNITQQDYLYPIEGTQYQCVGNESSLCECPQTNNPCESNMIIIIQCNLPANGELRLNHGHEGLLEFYYFGWGYVCDDFWDILDSNVACRSLGFKRASDFQSLVHPNSTDSFTIDDVHCTGSETNLIECPHKNSHNCYDFEHVYLTCEVDGCEAIAEQSDDSTVVIQYYDGQAWYHLCSDNFNMDDANVVCHENFGTNATTYENVHALNLTFGYPFYPYQHNCVGTEASLCYCPIEYRNCTSDYAVAIRCQRPAFGTLRLSNITEGYLEAFLYSDWGYVCFDNYYYYFAAYNVKHLADIACTQIGYLKAASFKAEYFGSSTEVPIINVDDCLETETDITQCGYTYIHNFCYYRFSLVCQTEGCKVVPDDIQSLTQLAQTYTDKSWFYLCFDGFTVDEADVYCLETTTTSSNGFTPSMLETLTIQRPIYPYQYDCNGTEDSLCSCPLDMEICDTNNVTTVTCLEPEFGATRLSDGYYGEIEVYTDQWRIVCQYDYYYNSYYYYYLYYRFNQYNADVACRGAGFRAATSFTDIYDDYDIYPHYSNSRYVSDISCVGDESSLTDCHYIDDSSCDHKPVVACDRSGCESFAGDADVIEKEVKFFTNGVWYYICAQEFTTQTGNVICHENGFGDLLSHSFVNASSNIEIYPQIHNCNGDEDSLCACPLLSEQCISNLVIALQCQPPVEGTVRVSNGANGFLQVYKAGWRRVCGYVFDHVAANVACRSLGYRNALSIIYEYTYVYTYNDESFITDITCTGAEKNILECEYTADDECYWENGMICEEGGCETYANDPLLLCPVNIYNEHWYTICSDNFGPEEAAVVCRELDHGEVSQFISVPRNTTDYPISPLSYNCNGNEESLCACETTQSTCASGNITHIQCQQPAFGHVRLTNGTSGLLEAYTDGWKRVCNYNYYWNQASSNVICRYLGYRDALSYSEVSAEYSFSSSGFINDVLCMGNVNNLTECVYDLTTYCYYHNIISCRTEGCQSYIFEAHTLEEPVRFYKDEEWFYICSTAIGLPEADIICKENGFTNGVESMNSTLRSQLDPVYEVYPFNIQCNGDESTLCACLQTPSTCGDEVATVKCASPDDGTVRYSPYYEYLIEIYSVDRWSFVCPGSWDSIDSLVACRQLGYTSVLFWYYFRLSHLDSIYPTQFIEVGCDGLEQNLGQCNHTNGTCVVVETYYGYSYSYYDEKVLLYCSRGDCAVHTPLTAGEDYHLVEYFINEKRYYICANGFTNENAEVVCRETAQTSAVMFRNVSELDLQTYANIYPLRHSCVGDEASLCNCSTSQEECTSGYIVEVLCGVPETGSIRVSSSDSSIEVYSDGWKYVCSYYFNHLDATVACRQLGYVTYDYWYWNYIVITDYEDYLLRDLSCEGSEANLLECTYTATTSCSYTPVVVCVSGSCESIIHNATYPAAIRLYDGHSNHYLCGGGVTQATADIVCREGGFGRSTDITSITRESTGVNYPISSNAYSCIGNERSLCDCPYTTETCETDNIAVVQCEMPENGQVRLHGEKVLQIYYYGIWRDVCYNNWDISDSAVACRQLGYLTSAEVDFFYNYFYDFSDYWVHNVVCFGNETKLSDCKYDLGDQCNYYNPVNLNCVSDGCESFAPGAIYSPQVARYYSDGWYYLCADDFTELNADVICNENGGVLHYNFIGVSMDWLTDTLPILQRKFDCFGNESSLCDCQSEEYTCSSNSVLQIQCLQPENGDIRLSNFHSGILEVFYHEWGYVCDDNWNMEAAIVACRQLGLGDVISSETGVIVEDRVFHYLIDDVVCTGEEENISQCVYTTKHNCGSNEHVRLSCARYEVIPVVTSPSDDEIINLTTFDGFTERSIDCSAEGIPTPDVYWTQNSVDRLGNPLVITEDILSDIENVFYCVAENAAGMDQHSVTYNVEIPAVITSPMEHTVTLTSLNVSDTIECQADGIPTPNVYWMVGEEVFVSTSTLMVTGGILVNSSNTFTCVAVNEFGTNMVSVTYVIDISPADVTDTLINIIDEIDNMDTINDETAGQIAAVVGNSVDLVLSNENSTAEENNEVLETAANTLETLVNKTNGTLSNETTSIVTNTLNTIITSTLDQTNETEPETGASQGSVATVSTALTIALRTLETFSSRLNDELLAIEGESSRVIESESITIVVQVVAITEDDIMLPVYTNSPANYSVALSISSEVAKALFPSGNRFAIATSFIKRPNKPISESGFSQASDILTISVGGKDGKITLVEEVSFEFVITSAPGFQSVCVYLEGDTWISTGLTLAGSKSTESLAVCESFHFTSFAVFVTPHEAGGSDVERIILSVLSYLLLGISFICLVAALILFCLAGKAFFKIETNIIYFNYCISMLLAVGLFLFGVESGKFNEVICKVIAFALHYAWLAVFTWTLCVGLLIMYKIVLGVMSNRKIYPYLIVFGWVFPLIIPLITVIVAREYYVDSSKHCFLAYEQGVIWAFIIPVFVLLLINVVILIITISKIIYSKWGNINNQHKDIIKDAMVTAMVLTPVLGIPWLILILNVSIRSTVVEYFFIILNGLIGLVFLLVVVIRNKEVQAILKRRKRIDGSGETPSGTVSTSATGSSTIASKFKKTGAEMDTLERVQAKEAEIEDAANYNVGFDLKSENQTEQNIYMDPIQEMEKGATPDVQPIPKKERKGLFGTTKTLFGGLKSSRKSGLEPLEDTCEVQIITDVKENPVYGITNLAFEASTNEGLAEVITNPVYGEVPELTENQYETN